MKRFKYHFEPKIGWMNDPNGLCYYKGKIHAFFQHNPKDVVWGPMHWGHAVTEDFIHWTEEKIAMYPDMPYEDDVGCFSGSTVVVNDTMHLFYTAVSKKLGQTQCKAECDGKKVTKYKNNPIITTPFVGSNKDFRDPKVIPYKDGYRMVVGVDDGGVGKILLYKSIDLTSWEFVNEIYSNPSIGGTPECPDLFKLEDKWVLKYSAIKPQKEAEVFVVGDFDGTNFKQQAVYYPFTGHRDYYAGQTFEMPDGRRIIIFWFYHDRRPLEKGATSAGGFSIPFTLFFKDGRLCAKPVEEVQSLFKDFDEHVFVDGTKITVLDGEATETFDVNGLNGISKIDNVKVLFDEKSVEIVVNDGQLVLAKWTN